MPAVASTSAIPKKIPNSSPQTGFARKVCIRLLLCATSVCSVSLWLFFLSNNEPQRHRAHRGCTEKSVYARFVQSGLNSEQRSIAVATSGRLRSSPDGYIRHSIHAAGGDEPVSAGNVSLRVSGQRDQNQFRDYRVHGHLPVLRLSRLRHHPDRLRSERALRRVEEFEALHKLLPQRKNLPRAR